MQDTGSFFKWLRGRGSLKIMPQQSPVQMMLDFSKGTSAMRHKQDPPGTLSGNFSEYKLDEIMHPIMGRRSIWYGSVELVQHTKSTVRQDIFAVSTMLHCINILTVSDSIL
jgi:hypothetical protein